MRQKIGIKKYEEKTTTKGKAYLLCTTNKGLMSVWDIEVAGVIMEAPESSVFDAELEVNGKFTSIMAIYNVSQGTVEDVAVIDTADLERQLGYALSYAKDAWCAGKIEKEELLDTAVGFMEVKSELMKRYHK